MTAPAVVTGATGWLGARLVTALAGQDRVIRCLVRRGHDLAPLREIPGPIELIEGDLTEPDSLPALFAGTSEAVVFHGAGVIHPRRVREFYDVNTEGTRRLLQAAIQAGARRFIYVSSTSPLGFNPGPDLPFDESSPYQPFQNYGRSKQLAEELVNAANSAAKIETVIARAPWFYGPGQPLRQTRFFTMIKNGTVPIVGRGENLRSLAYVDSLSQGLLRCEQVPGARGQTYWLADPQPYPMNQIVDTIERVMEKDFGIQVAHRRRRLPALASDLASVLDSALQKLGFYRAEIHVLAEISRNLACSIAKAERELGYHPEITLEQGMRRSIQSLFERGVSF